jgi:alpha-L-fucosidase
MKKSLLTAFAILITVAGFCQTTLTNPRTDKKLLKNFQDARLGLFVHWMACFTPANTAGGPFKQGDWGGSTYKANKIFLHLRGNQQQVSINKLKGYKMLSATEITSGKKLNIIKSGKGYNIEIPKNFEGVDIPVIALTLNKQFVFTHWLSIQ